MQNPVRFIFTACFLVLFVPMSFCQVQRLAAVCRPGMRLYVSVYAGLSLRDTPSMTGKILTVVKFAEPVIVVADGAKAVPVTNSGIPGRWVKVKYKEFTGYQFDGFLSRYPPMNQYNDVRSYGEFQDYLKEQFEVESYRLTEQDTVSGDSYWEEIKFTNGIVYTRSGVEYAFMSLSFPSSVITFQEVYFMARSAYPTVFYGKDSTCGYQEGSLLCEFIGQPLIIRQEMNTILFTEGLEGH